MAENAQLNRLSERIEELNRQHFKVVRDLELLGYGIGSNKYNKAYERFSKRVLDLQLEYLETKTVTES